MFLTFIAFIFVIGILVIVHELGHFLAAKWAGVKVEEFSVGFPPRIASFKRGETQYTIGLLPLGGYVKMLGEEESSKDKRAYNNQSPGKRFLIGIAGVLMNVILAWLILTIGFMVGMTPLASPVNEIPGKVLVTKIYITQILKDSPADQAGLQPGDILSGASFGGTDYTFRSPEEVTSFTLSHIGDKINVKITRDNKNIDQPVQLLGGTSSPLGIAMVDQSVVRVKWYLAPIIAVRETYRMVTYMIEVLRQFFALLFSTGHLSNDVGGPVAIYTLSGVAARAGVMSLFQFIAMLSANLALINILPFPALDGGRVLFIVLEKIFRKRIVREEVENIIHTIGFAILILFILLITYSDIIKRIHR